MQITNSFHVPLPAEQAWAVLLDVPRIAPCMPGARLDTTDADSDTYAGEVQVRLGPVLLVFRGRALLKEVVPASHRALVRAEGRDTKGRGSASADVAFALVPEGEETRVDITTNLTLSGSVAQYGRSAGMINDLANHIIGQFAANLRKEIGAATEAQESRSSASALASEAGAGQGPDSRAAESAGGSAQVQRAKPISGLRLGLWLIWRQLMRVLGRDETRSVDVRTSRDRK